MVKITVEEALHSFGLSSKESRIYLASLELGTTTANDIANKADINRSTTYDILKLFLEKGIGSKVVKDGTAHFEVVGPHKLIAILDDKKVKLRAVMNQLELIKEKTVEKPTVQVFEGHAGIKTILEDTLANSGRNDIISTSKIFKIFGYYFPHYIVRKKPSGVHSRVIQETCKETTELKKRDKFENRETRGLTNFDVNSVTFIYGDKVAIIKLRKNELIGVVIKDRTLAEDKRRIFEILWKLAK
ncbi:TPA: hypothetical protein HA278_08570 [Candidatus Woesearchaeota archaeon]|nr:hypothetical protein [archaeon]HIJ12085.1 hypothetical protein [Candidatus Woesearchaeota archaeon]|tara:strand:- start:263 stop:994 length:732 start_codon:yes stop_codon:yes gene_type:complete